MTTKNQEKIKSLDSLESPLKVNVKGLGEMLYMGVSYEGLAVFYGRMPDGKSVRIIRVLRKEVSVFDVPDGLFCMGFDIGKARGEPYALSDKGYGPVNSALEEADL